MREAEYATGVDTRAGIVVSFFLLVTPRIPTLDRLDVHLQK